MARQAGDLNNAVLGDFWAPEGTETTEKEESEAFSVKREASESVERSDRGGPCRRRAAARFAGLLGACPQTPGDFPLMSLRAKRGNLLLGQSHGKQ